MESEQPSDDYLFDSCWGFYGNDNTQSGLLKSAKDSIDGLIKHEREKRRKEKKENRERRLKVAEEYTRQIYGEA